MLRQLGLAEMPSVDDDPELFDPTPEWFVPGLTPMRGEMPEEDDEVGLRAILERPDALAKAWHASGAANNARGRRSRTSSYAE